ncbi:hypothetical protein EDC30_11838 [Paucimonas lemoignei]|uniref:Uncharacterized protein n=1 Tax=Paucimonas lemoignei TaxID=29443 RepID=A0A4R3HRW6_PAULE|nr:hypothetical protein EDC30_11838 [Paucimonas lemoignei]
MNQCLFQCFKSIIALTSWKVISITIQLAYLLTMTVMLVLAKR